MYGVHFLLEKWRFCFTNQIYGFGSHVRGSLWSGGRDCIVGLCVVPVSKLYLQERMSDFIEEQRKATEISNVTSKIKSQR